MGVYLIAEFLGGIVAGGICRLLLATKHVPDDPEESPRHTTKHGGDGSAGQHIDMTTRNEPLPSMGASQMDKRNSDEGALQMICPGLCTHSLLVHIILIAD